MATENTQNNQLNVLVVEDDSDIGQIIDLMLREMGFRTIVLIRDGIRGWNEFRKSPDKYQIVISDWEMPKMNGLQLLKAVRKIRPETLFMMLTVRSDPDAIMAAQKEGVTAYVAKPFSPRLLQEKMAQLVEILLERKKEGENNDDVVEI